jgi:hypothetical protein
MHKIKYFSKNNDIIEHLNLDIGDDPLNGRFILPNGNKDQTISINLVGRYVRYRPSTNLGDGWINPSQIIVSDINGNNLALNKLTYTTSIYPGSKFGSYVVDGSTTIRNFSWAPETGGRLDFIEIDLGSNNYISNIRVLQNTSCCDPGDPSGYYSDRTTNSRIEILYDVLVTNFPTSTTPTILTAPALSTGRYVRIHQITNQTVPNLTFSFINVRNSLGESLSANKNAYSTSNYSGYNGSALTAVYGTNYYKNFWPWVFSSGGTTSNEWWEVDLGKSETIANVVGYDNTTDSSGADVTVSSVSGLGIYIINFSNITVTQSLYSPKSTNTLSPINSPSSNISESDVLIQPKIPQNITESTFTPGLIFTPGLTNSLESTKTPYPKTSTILIIIGIGVTVIGGMYLLTNNSNSRYDGGLFDIGE